MTHSIYSFSLLALAVCLSACGGGSDPSVSGDTSGTSVDATDDSNTNTSDSSGSSADSSDYCTSLHTAFHEFGENVEVVLNSSNCTVTLEATGKPDHSSPYWDPNGANADLYEAPGDETVVANMSPGYIDGFGDQLYAMTVSTDPELASGTTATSLGAVGIAVSGSPIFNDQEGPNVNLDLGVIKGFDKNGAHTGPEVYHYHLEPTSISEDDDSLIGIIADGFFIYGRKCYSVAGYPTDLDASGGHVSITQHTGADDADAQYHYHIKDEYYLTAYYLLFPEDYQGTPVAISR